MRAQLRLAKPCCGTARELAVLAFESRMLVWISWCGSNSCLYDRLLSVCVHLVNCGRRFGWVCIGRHLLGDAYNFCCHKAAYGVYNALLAAGGMYGRTFVHVYVSRARQFGPFYRVHQRRESAAARGRLLERTVTI